MESKNKKSPKISELSNEELLKKYKMYKGLLITQAVMIGFLAGICIYLTVKNGFSVFTILPVCFLGVLMPSIIFYGSAKKEMKARNL